MQGYSTNIEQDALGNDNFRRVLYTAKHSQLVIMSLLPGEEIGEEVHKMDQFIRCEAGEGKAIVNDKEHPMNDGFVIVVPAGAKHNVINTSSEHPMKLYTLYAPPDHLDQTVHKTKADAEASDPEWDGKTTEPLD